MSKTKVAGRLLSGILAILMVFCLFPKVEVQAEEKSAQGISIDYRFEKDRKSNVDSWALDYLWNEIWNQNTSTVAVPGTEFIVPIPAKTEFTVTTSGIYEGITYKLTEIEIFAAAGDYDDTSAPYEEFSLNGEDWEFSFTENYDNIEPIQLPESLADTVGLKYDTGVVEEHYILHVFYNWEITSNKITPNKNVYITNSVNSLTRTITQRSTQYVDEVVEGQTYTYEVADKKDIVLNYSATMNMEKLGVVTGQGTQSWNWWSALNQMTDWIYDNTSVDLHFRFDPHLDLQRASEEGLLNSISLESDMFSLKNSDPSQSYSIDVEKNELIIHCRWDSDRAVPKKGSLNPLITLTGVTIPISEDWAGDSVGLSNYGYVDGITYMGPKASSNDFYIPLDKFDPNTCSPQQFLNQYDASMDIVAIDGGNKTDTFTLTLPEPQPPEEPSSEPEEDEPSTVIPDTTPTISIRKVWVEDTEAARPDSILVEIYHEEELYDTIEIEGKYNWRASYNIPARYEEADWWVEEADVPAYYDSSVEETRDNVFVITNTYDEPEVVIEESSEPSEPAPEPSQPSEYIPEPSEEPSSEPAPEPAEPSEPTLPQTGQLWWPVPVLLLCGAVAVASGALRSARRNRK